MAGGISMAEYVLALDQGTTSCRSILFSQDGSIVAVAQQEFEQILPFPGHVEHDANQIWDSQLATAREVLHSSGVELSDVKAIGITNQRETTVAWNPKTGKPYYNAIVWCDTRTKEIADRFTEKYGQNHFKKT